MGVVLGILKTGRKRLFLTVSVYCSTIVTVLRKPHISKALVSVYFNYALMGGAPEAYSSHSVCGVCLCVCMSLAPISLQWLKTKY